MKSQDHLLFNQDRDSLELKYTDLRCFNTPNYNLKKEKKECSNKMLSFHSSVNVLQPFREVSHRRNRCVRVKTRDTQSAVGAGLSGTARFLRLKDELKIKADSHNSRPLAAEPKSTRRASPAER